MVIVPKSLVLNGQCNVLWDIISLLLRSFEPSSPSPHSAMQHTDSHEAQKMFEPEWISQIWWRKTRNLYDIYLLYKEKQAKIPSERSSCLLCNGGSEQAPATWPRCRRTKGAVTMPQLLTHSLFLNYNKCFHRNCSCFDHLPETGTANTDVYDTLTRMTYQNELKKIHYLANNQAETLLCFIQ